MTDLNITTEYLDTALSRLSEELKQFVKAENTSLEGKLKQFVKAEIRTENEGLEMRLKQFIREEDDNLGRMVAEGLDDLEKRLNVNQRTDKLENEFTQLKQALRI